MDDVDEGAELDEELELGPPPPAEENRINPLIWLVAALAGLAVAVLVLGRTTPSPSRALLAPTPTPRAFQTVRPGPLEYLDIGNVCSVRTDRRRTLSVSFELVNGSGTGVEVLDVRPSLPLKGLRRTGPTTTGGTCGQPAAHDVKQVIQPGDRLLFTMNFRLPHDCPQPLPVEAAYRIDVNGQEMTTRVHILGDLGSVDFDTCPARSR
jgi:hypothetical protein